MAFRDTVCLERTGVVVLEHGAGSLLAAWCVRGRAGAPGTGKLAARGGGSMLLGWGSRWRGLLLWVLKALLLLLEVKVRFLPPLWLAVWI